MPSTVAAPFRRWSWRIFRIAGLAYLGICLLVAWNQRSLVFRPEQLSSPVLQRMAADRGFLPWTNAAGLRIGWWRAASIGSATARPGAVLILHGNAGSAVGREYLADPLQQAFPLPVYILEYPGYGDRPGSPSEHAFLSAADEAFATLPARVPVYLVSESLGTGAAAWLAGNHPDRVQGICCLVPYDRLVRVARHQMPWLPVELLLLDRFPAEDWLRGFHGPAAFCVAGADQVIPPQRGLHLHEAYAGPKRLWVLPGVDHNGALARPVAWWREVVALWAPGSIPSRTP